MSIAGIIIAVVAIVLAVLFGSKTIDRQENLKNIPANIKQWSGPVERASSRTGVPADIIYSVLWTESSGNENAVGSAGEVGLMQLKDIAVKDVEQNFGVNMTGWRTDPKKNILAGAYFLKLQHRRTGTWTKAIQAYNQGARGARENPELASRYFKKVNGKREFFG